MCGKGTISNLSKMACSKDVINLRAIYSFTSLELIQKCQEWHLLPAVGDKKCPKCFKNLKLIVRTRGIDGYEWWCAGYISSPGQKQKQCSYRSSLRAGTVFAFSKLKMWKIVGFIRLWLRGASRILTCEELEISKQTYTDWSAFCREVVYDVMIMNSDKLGGPGIKVQIIESKFGTRTYNHEYIVEGQWVFGGFEEETGKIFMVPVESRCAESLLPVIERWIHPETTIISDCWKSYECLTQHGYKHSTVNHPHKYKDPGTGARTNRAKKKCPPAPNKIFNAGYLAKYMFLKLCKFHNSNPFLEFCKFAGKLYDGSSTTSSTTANCKTEDHTYCSQAS